jgi:hypothetical protein
MDYVRTVAGLGFKAWHAAPFWSAKPVALKLDMKNGFCRTLCFFSSSLVLVVSAATLPAVDVQTYTVSKGVYYAQNSSGYPVAETNNGYVFDGQVKLQAAGYASGAQVQIPDGTSQVLAADGDTLEYKKKYNTASKLEANYPDGLYILTINTAHDGTRTAYLGLSGSAYPNAPRISNYAEAQTINAHGWFVLKWDRFSGGTVADFIQLKIEDSAGKKVFETPDVDQPDGYNGAATLAWIPPDTLSPGKVYSATLTFQKVTSRSSNYAGALGLAYYFSRTTFSVVTTTQSAPDVEDYIITKGRSFEQTNDWSIIPEEGKEFIFDAKVDSAGAGVVLKGFLTSAAGSTLPLLIDGKDAEYEDAGPTAELLDSKFPTGTYTFELNLLHDGTKRASVDFVDCPYPPAPHLTSFDPSQEIRAEQDLLICWDEWTGGSYYDFIQVRVEDSDGKKIFETAGFGDKDALDSKATRVTVPAGTLMAGEDYKARIVFTKVVAADTSAYAGVIGLGTYFTRTKFDIRTAPPDVKAFSVAKGHVFVQSNSGDPVLHPSMPYAFAASVIMAGSNTVNGASITTPGGTIRQLIYQGDGKTWLFQDGSSDQNTIEVAYPDGAYALTIYTVNQGTRTIQLPINGYLYPNSPHISNYSAAQTIDPAKSFTVRWDAFVGGTTNDYIYAAVLDPAGAIIDDSKRFGSSSALDGTDTSYKISSDTLAPGRTFNGSITFERILAVDEKSYPGVLGFSGLFSRTMLGLATKATAPLAFTKFLLNSNGRMEATFTSVSGNIYRIDTSTDLQSWAPAATVTASGSETTWVDPITHPKCYYRVVTQ